MTILVKDLFISNEYRAARMKDGLDPGPRQINLFVDLGELKPKDRAELIPYLALSDDGETAYCTERYCGKPELSAPTLEALISYARNRNAEKAKDRAKAEKNEADRFAQEAQKKADREALIRTAFIHAARWNGDYLQTDTRDGKIITFTDWDDQAIRGAAQKIADKRRDEEKQETAKAEAEKKEARQKVITDWVTVWGTQNQKERFKLDLLPEKEVIDAIRNQAYAPLDKFPRYDRISCEDLNHNANYCADSVTYDSMDDVELTAEEFVRYCEINAAMPQAWLVTRLHTATCECGADEIQRKAVLVKLSTVGGFEFSREYAL